MTILPRLQAWALTILAVLLVLFGAYAIGGRAARRATTKKYDYEEAVRAAAGSKGRYDAEIDARSLPDGGAANELRSDWMRREADPE